MARKINYGEKIGALEEKIEKKQGEIKALKAKLAEIQAKKTQSEYAELAEYMQTNNLTAEEVLACIKD